MTLAERVRFENMTERSWAKWVGDRCKEWGWLRYHTHRSDYSPAGFPDECLVRPPRLVFVELKSERGYHLKDHGLSPQQQEWRAALEQVPGVEYYLWRPADVDDVTRILAPPGWRIHH